MVGGDGAGHWQGWDHAIFYSWVHDTSPPTGVSLEINNGDGYTRQAQVTLTLAAMEAAEMCLKRGADCTNCSSWEPVAASRPWSLQPAEEETIATVSAQFRDEAGNLSVCVSSSIHHDSLPPNNP